MPKFLDYFKKKQPTQSNTPAARLGLAENTNVFIYTNTFFILVKYLVNSTENIFSTHKQQNNKIDIETEYINIKNHVIPLDNLGLIGSNTTRIYGEDRYLELVNLVKEQIKLLDSNNIFNNSKESIKRNLEGLVSSCESFYNKLQKINTKVDFREVIDKQECSKAEELKTLINIIDNILSKTNNYIFKFNLIDRYNNLLKYLKSRNIQLSEIQQQQPSTNRRSTRKNKEEQNDPSITKLIYDLSNYYNIFDYGLQEEVNKVLNLIIKNYKNLNESNINYKTILNKVINYLEGKIPIYNDNFYNYGLVVTENNIDSLIKLIQENKSELKDTELYKEFIAVYKNTQDIEKEKKSKEKSKNPPDERTEKFLNTPQTLALTEEQQKTLHEKWDEAQKTLPGQYDSIGVKTPNGTKKETTKETKEPKKEIDEVKEEIPTKNKIPINNRLDTLSNNIKNDQTKFSNSSMINYMKSINDISNELFKSSLEQQTKISYFYTFWKNIIEYLKDINSKIINPQNKTTYIGYIKSIDENINILQKNITDENFIKRNYSQYSKNIISYLGWMKNIVERI